MIAIFTDIITALEAGEQCVLATLIRTRGSAPQKAGARLLIRQDGSALGTVGGGCMEGDIWYAAKEMMRLNKPSQLLHYRLNEEMAARDGLVCGGTMFFWLERLTPDGGYASLSTRILAALDGGGPLTVATVINPGESPLPLGQRLLIEPGQTDISPEAFQAWPESVIKKARTVAACGETCHMMFSGGLEIVLEGFTTPPTLIILGGGHVGKALAELAARLKFNIVIIDDREDFANPERFPEARQTIVADFENAFDRMIIRENSYIVVATRGHRYDDQAVAAALETPARYIGLLGSKRKTLMIYKNLYQKGVPLEKLLAIKAPIGLDIGALSPEELAVSIMGEIIVAQRGGGGGPMSLTETDIKRTLNNEK